MKLFFRVAAWLFLVWLTIVTVVPASDRPITGIDHNFEHLLAFLLLGILFALAYPDRFLQLLLGGTAFALLTELSQIPLPTRHARLSDFLVNTFAAWLGVCVVLVFRKFLRSVRFS